MSVYSFSGLVLMSVLYTFGRNEHVRVDVFREGQSVKIQQWVDIVSIVLFLIPFFALILYWVWPDIQYAWSIKEGSQETGGLGGLYLVKSILPMVSALMIVQGLIVILKRGVYLNAPIQTMGANQ
jgi:TRAP-type mannitol/chloroaromatic compound transport system permease small subunit